MKYYNLSNLDQNKILAVAVIKDYIDNNLSIMKIAIKHKIGYQIVRKILLDNNVKLREGNKKNN